MSLDGKVALVTGGGGGIGRETASRMASMGARVVVGDISDVDGEGTASGIRRSGGDSVFIPVDVTQPTSVAALMEAAAAWGGGLDVLFNNAGIGPPDDARVTDLDEGVWHRVMAVNLTGVFLCCKYAFPFLVDRGGGSVINTASIAGLRGNSTIPSTAYTVSKAGVIALTRQCAVDYAKAGVRVNAICPGPIDTHILEPFLRDPTVRQRFSEGVPLGRIGQPTDIASLVVFLASDESSWMHGSIITIDGGLTA